MKVKRAGEVIVKTICNLDVGRGWAKAPRPGRFSPWEDSIAIIQEARWASEQSWTGRENFANTDNRTQDRPAHSESLYQLFFPGRLYILVGRSNSEG